MATFFLMANNWEKLAGASSIILRLSAFIFLRWIPGHHFPRLIVAALVVYLFTVFFKWDQFATRKVRLHKLFPKLFPREEIVDLDTQETERVDVVLYDDEPAFYEDEHPFLKTLLCGVPDWREKEFSIVTIAANILLGLLTLDLVFRGPALYSGDNLRFTRVGFVDSASARILVREPDPIQLPIYTYFRPENESVWQSGDRVWNTALETDFTYALELKKLRPDTRYVYTLSNNLNGTFQTAPLPSSPASGSLTFLTSSCIKANFPYNPFSHSLAIHGFEYLSRLITSLRETPAFMLFLGDFIYVDVPQRLSSTVSHYRSEYRRVYASPSWSLPGIGTVPWLHTLDDHEIANDWSGGNDTSPFPEASDPFIHYHVSVNPPTPPLSPSGPGTKTTYFQFTRGPASFFMLDTRRYRTDPESGNPTGLTSKPLYGSSSSSNNPSPVHKHATMLGDAQRKDLLRFLSRPEADGVHWKIITSSVPFTKNWRFGTPDTWGGFLHERAQILEAMHKAERDLGIRVIILSGDRHEFAAIRFPPLLSETIKSSKSSIISETAREVYDTKPQSGPHEFSVGPLSMFYLPFRTFKQIDEQDVSIAYFPDGNSKIGMIEIGNMAAGAVDAVSPLFGRKTKPAKVNDGIRQKSWLRYSLYIDGEVKWQYMITSPGPD